MRGGRYIYVDDIRATTRRLRAEGLGFWADPRSHRVGEAAGIATEVVFEGPDGVAVNLVQPEGGPDTFTKLISARFDRRRGLALPSRSHPSPARSASR